MSDAASQESHFDIAIIGGGAMGLAVAEFMRREDPSCSICVIEADTSYAFASTPRASGGLRRLFGIAENIQMSDFSIRYFADLLKDCAPADGWQQNGYLFIAPTDKVRVLRENLAVQLANGVDAQFLEVEQLASRFPSMRVDDLGGAVLSPDDGWLDPAITLKLMHARVLAAGIAMIAGEVVSITRIGAQATSLSLRDGRRITFGHVVNATGAWAAQVCRMVDLEAPIEPMRRFEHRFERNRDIEPLPYIKDTERLAFRPAGPTSYTGGLPQYTEPGGLNFAVDEGYFDRIVRPALAHRVPALADCRVLSTRSGLYDQNRFDGSPIIGASAMGPGNFHLIAGFSGHGLMHAPAAARGLAENIVHGSYRTIDLARFGWKRLHDITPQKETGIV